MIYIYTMYILCMCIYIRLYIRYEAEKLQKFVYLENEKSFLDEIKNIIHSF